MSSSGRSRPGNLNLKIINSRFVFVNINDVQNVMMKPKQKGCTRHMTSVGRPMYMAGRQNISRSRPRRTMENSRLEAFTIAVLRYLEKTKITNRVETSPREERDRMTRHATDLQCRYTWTKRNEDGDIDRA